MIKIFAILVTVILLFSAVFPGGVPAGLSSFEKEGDALPAEATAAPESDAADMVLYYQPDGGEYYHLDQNCVSVNPVFLPLQGSFSYSELEDEPYRALKRCHVCDAPFRSEE